MPFSLRELAWMLDAKTEQHTETVAAMIDAIYKSMAMQMALSRSQHSGKRTHPDEFYKTPKRRSERVVEQAINKDGFAMMKRHFVKE